MDQMSEFLKLRNEAKGETLLDQAVRLALKRRNLMKTVCSSHRTSGTLPVTIDVSRPGAN